MLTIKTARVDQGTKNQSSTKAIPYIGVVLLPERMGERGNLLKMKVNPKLKPISSLETWGRKKFKARYLLLALCQVLWSSQSIPFLWSKICEINSRNRFERNSSLI